MEHKLERISEEEGRIIFSEKEKDFFTAEFFLTGEDEAEFKIQNIILENELKTETIVSEKGALKITECILECFRLLWDEGLEEVVLVERKGTPTAKILDSAAVVTMVYSEYMMKRHIEPQMSANGSFGSLVLTKTEDGYVCGNKEKTFFCRLLSYEAEQAGEQSFYLYEVKVKKKSRNKGIATKCLTTLFSMLSQETPLTVYLQVGSYNEPAVHLYKKLEFDISEEFGYYAPIEEQG